MTSIDAIEGIGPAAATTLRDAGVRTCERLLSAGASRSGRRELATETGIDEARLLAWVNRADLMRVRGVSTQYSDLLEAAGVDTVKELRRRNPENLAAAMEQANTAGHDRLVRRTPSATMVAGWVAAATELDPVVTH